MRQVKALHTLMQTIERLINDTATPIIAPTKEQDIGTPPVPSVGSIPVVLVDDEGDPTHFYPGWGLTMREAADALISVFGHRGTPDTPEPIGDSSSGIEPCGYEEL